MKKQTLVLLITALLLIFIGSLVASISNTSGGNVDVSRVSFETESGELSGLLYLPDGAEEEPRPTIIATHGFLNSGEMQAPQAIEMSKRGYPVLALDLYDHGHSVGTMDKSIPFFSFWPTAIYDAVNYMYEQDFVLKDDEGNGMIAVSGHSMGGFSSTHAVMLDEMFYQEAGIRKINSYLTMGSDYQWIYSLGYEIDDILNAYGPRTAGKIASTYDEFFFNLEAANQGRSVIEKDYITTDEGQAFLANFDNPVAGEFFEVGDGQRIIYQPEEIHPWNHFSMTTTEHVIDFYDVAFAEHSGLVDIGEQGQSWMYKEWFSFIALIGFFLLFVPVIQLLSKVPFLSNVIVKKPAVLPMPSTDSEKASNLMVILFSALFPALLFTSFYSGDESGMRILSQINLVIIVTSFVTLILSYVKNKQSNIKKVSLYLLLISIVQFVLIRNQSTLIDVNDFLGAPTGSPILYWAVNVAVITLMILVGKHFLSNRQKGATVKHYGLKINIKSIISSLIIALVSIAIGYAVLFLVDAVFKTDFRLWTLAVKTFEFNHLIALLKYAPFFFLFYFLVGLSININTSDKKFDGIKGYLLSMFMFVGGLILYLGYHYGFLFVTGEAGYPGEALSSIVVIGLVPVLIIAAVYNRYFYRLTGNIYLGAFLNTLLMTLITLANTALYATL